VASPNPRQLRFATVSVRSVSVTTTVVETSDGRELCVESGGDPTGATVLNIDGWPSGRSLPGELLDGAAGAGVHLLGYDRPGYGRSSPHPERTVASCAADIRAIALAFGIDRLGVCGASGGGPHALAVGALLPDLVTGVAAICSLAPRDGSGLDYLAGMQDDIAQIHRWLDEDLGAVRRWATSYRTEVEGYSAEEIERLPPQNSPRTSVPGPSSAHTPSRYSQRWSLASRESSTTASPCTALGDSMSAPSASPSDFGVVRPISTYR
jgi:pimeloyl-ACP methyl ester carboxylesterase